MLEHSDAIGASRSTRIAARRPTSARIQACRPRPDAGRTEWNRATAWPGDSAAAAWSAPIGLTIPYATRRRAGWVTVQFNAFRSPDTRG